MSRGVVMATALASVLLVAATGCGGDGTEGSETATETTSTGSEDSVRLTTEQWSAYEASAAAFVEARVTATAKLDACPDPSAEAYGKCTAPALDALQAAAQDLGDTLAGFNDTVTGACLDASVAFQTYVTPYVNAVQALEDAIADGNVAEIPSAKATLTTLTESGQEERQAFEDACAPL